MESVCVIGARQLRGADYPGAWLRTVAVNLARSRWRRAHHLADLTVAQVADTLGLPTGTVKARLSRGRAALSTLHSTRRATTCQHSTGAST